MVFTGYVNRVEVNPVADIPKETVQANLKWHYVRKGLNLSQEVINEAAKSLELMRCPVCKGELSSVDNFGIHLPQDQFFPNRSEINRYCPTDNLIIQLVAQKPNEDRLAPNLEMKIYTNAKYSVIIARSGDLTDPLRR
jgi:hypothetical protein